MTKDQLTLILFLETQVVDHAGRVNGIHMNKADFEQCRKWNDEHFIGFGRIASDDINSNGSHWVTFSDKAWFIAHEQRRARGARLLKQRTYRTTEEKRAQAVA